MVRSYFYFEAFSGWARLQLLELDLRQPLCECLSLLPGQGILHDITVVEGRVNCSFANSSIAEFNSIGQRQKGVRCYLRRERRLQTTTSGQLLNNRRKVWLSRLCKGGPLRTGFLEKPPILRLHSHSFHSSLMIPNQCNYT